MDKEMRWVSTLAMVLILAMVAGQTVAAAFNPATYDWSKNLRQGTPSPVQHNK